MGEVVVGEASDFHNLLIYMSQLMQDKCGETALFATCSQGRYDSAALLIDHRADMNYLSKVKPLHGYPGIEWCAQFIGQGGGSL